MSETISPSPPSDPVAVLPVTETQAVAKFSYHLQCFGAGKESNIQWTKNGEQLLTSDSVHLANNNASLKFEPLSQFDTGIYQCIVREQEVIIPGTQYVLDVICECMTIYNVYIFVNNNIFDIQHTVYDTV